MHHLLKNLPQGYVITETTLLVSGVFISSGTFAVSDPPSLDRRRATPLARTTLLLANFQVLELSFQREQHTCNEMQHELKMAGN